MAPYPLIFSLTIVINAAATFRSSIYWIKLKRKAGSVSEGNKNEDQSSTEMEEVNKPKHSNLLRRYLVVYLLAAISDWLQGPYVYALYLAYGYSQHTIAVLFVAGFGSSMIFGSFIGSLADSYGRRNFTVIYAIVYAASCVTKHFKDYYVLMLGRILGGIATSLLFSVFDSWLIRSHSDAGLSTYISKSFSAAAYGNSIVAICAGLFANKVTSLGDMVPMFSTATEDNAILWRGGLLNPFDMAIFALILCAIFAVSMWEENYGQDKAEDENEDPSSKEAATATPWYFGFTSALQATTSSIDVLLCGLICSLFEGSMYVFVFMWTPAMINLTKLANPNADEALELPFGLIFSTFMVCAMAGSSTFSILIEKYEVTHIGFGLLCVATCAFALMAKSQSDTATFLSFLLFEVCVGVYFPTMGTMKSIIVPENKRTAIYNLYRIPLNFIVLSSLLTDLTYRQSFYVCTLMMATATFLQRKLIQEQKSKVIIVRATDEELQEPLVDNTNLHDDDDKEN